MAAKIEEVDPAALAIMEVQSIADAEARGLAAARSAGATIKAPGPRVGGPAPPPIVQPWFRPNTPEEMAKPIKRPERQPRQPIPPLQSPKREPKVGDRVLYWLANPGTDGGANLVPADVYSLGNTLIDNGSPFGSANLNVHEPGFIQWAGDCGYCTKPRVGCWCYPGDVK